MSNFYQRFRNEIAAGGAVEEKPSEESPRQRVVSGLVVLALLAYLAVRSPWTFVFVVGLLVSVFLHEIGHFITARRTGMKVTQFFMGFGPRIWSTQRGEVEYGIRALPLGAFVRIIGMNNLDDVDEVDEPRTYRSKSYPRRLLVITAGSLVHILIALTIFTGVYSTWGREQETGRVTVNFMVDGDTTAHAAGMQEGDVIESIGGVRVSNRDELVATIGTFTPGDDVTIVYQRGDQVFSPTVKMRSVSGQSNFPFLGVATSSRDYVQLAPQAAIGRSVTDMFTGTVDSARGILTALNPVNSVRHLTNTDTSLETRPTTIVGASQVGGAVGRSDGLKGVLLLLASLNVFVGVFNMLPLLPFDGGHAAIATYERLRSRAGRQYRADISKMVPVATLVVGLLGFLLLAGLYLDITKPLG